VIREADMEELGTRIETQTHGDVAVVSLVGEHDLATAETVRAQLQASVESGGGLVVSLMKTEFCDSTVVKALFHADEQLREREQRLVLHVATASIVRRMLDVSGLGDAVPCTGSLEEAIALARPPAGNG
jgi:anti-sigma B factor antagonist